MPSIRLPDFAPTHLQENMMVTQDPHSKTPFSGSGYGMDVPARPSLHWLQVGLLVGGAVFIASLFGVWTRLAGQLAVFWPANALLLGLLLRFPRLDTPAGWIGAAAGYLIGGWVAGDGPLINVVLTIGNFVSVLAGYLMLVRLSQDDLRLIGPGSILLVVWIAFITSVAAGVAGSVIGPYAFGGTPWSSGLAWFVSEAVNYIAILPAVLTIPSDWRRPVARQWRGGRRRKLLRRVLPLASLVVSMGLALLVGGPGAIAFPVPALLWCGMRYGLFPTSLLTVCTTAWTLLAISKGHLDMSVNIESSHMQMSIRLGVTLIAMSPIAVASVMSAHAALTSRLRHMADHDPLTGIMNRRAFADHASEALRNARAANTPVGLMILDIDRFKSVNDSYGHAAGDRVIVHIADCLMQHLPADACLLGRVGGEEFAVLLPGSTRTQTLEVAERMRQACAETAVDVGEGCTLTATVSIGACVSHLATEPLEQLLQIADQALYDAKREGRNRVVLRNLQA
jgi:diguanylate cyclase (GGDEF)-like protein